MYVVLQLCFAVSDYAEISPRLKSAPAITVEIEKGQNGLGLGLIDGLVSKYISAAGLS